MPSKTEAKTFTELMDDGFLQIGDGYRAKNNELGGDGIIFLRAGHVGDGHIDFAGADRFIGRDASDFGPKVSQAGDVIVTTKGNSTGRIAFVASDSPAFVYSPHLSYWRSLNEGVLVQGFLRAWSRGPEFKAQLDAMSRSTDMAPYLSLTDQRRLRITLPPVAVQQEVSVILDALEHQIGVLRATNATLESIAQAIFKSWFVDFDPVRAKAEGLEPEGMDAATAALFPSEFEESELGLIPKGWSVGQFGHFATLAKGSVNPQSEPDREYEHYSLPAFDLGQLPLPELGGTIKSNKTRVPANAVLQSKLNPHIPRVWLPGYVGENAVCSTEFLPWVSRPEASVELIYCLLTSTAFGSAVRTLVTGTSNSHQRVKAELVASLAVTKPNLAVVAAFTDAVRPLLTRVIHNRSMSKGLAETRDALLPRLISGKLRIPEAEELVQETIA
jgi:type I restriction enzyme S subunit